MELIIGKTAGFCFGVSNAVNKTLDTLKSGKTYCLGELVHNKNVTEELINNGLEIIDDINKAKNNLIIRAHGADEKTYQVARQRNLNIIDLTCPKVLNIHNMVKKYKEKDYYVFLIGYKEHPETIATISYCDDVGTVIQDISEIDEAINIFKKSKKEKALIISQTTFSIEKFESIVDEIKKTIGDRIEVKNTICSTTRLRQEETKRIAKEVDAMIIIGGKNSSNTNKLYDIAKNICEKSFLVEGKEDIDFDIIKDSKKVGIMAGASTPEKSIKAVVEILNKMC